mgnify:CR=1 FL=1
MISWVAAPCSSTADAMVDEISEIWPMPAPINEQSLALAQRDYRKLSMETAQRTMRFWQLHNKIEK